MKDFIFQEILRSVTFEGSIKIMDKKLPLISYTLAAFSGICFIGGLIILSSEGSTDTCTELRRSYQC